MKTLSRLSIPFVFFAIGVIMYVWYSLTYIPPLSPVKERAIERAYNQRRNGITVEEFLLIKGESVEQSIE